MRENTSCESSRENAIAKLNLIIDDYEKDNNTIDKENIHLYYEFMSDEELKNYSSLIWEIISNRFQLIKDELATVALDDTIYRYDNDIIVIDDIDNSKIGITIFGIKDTLKPIDEYIKEIKESEQYNISNFETIKTIQVSRFVADGLSQQFPKIRNKYDDSTKDAVEISGTIYGYEIDINALLHYIASQYGTTISQDNEKEITEQFEVVMNAIKTNRDIPFTIQWKA